MPEVSDLFILTEDSQIQSTLRSLLEFRRLSLGIRDIAFEIRRHQNKDPGCRTESASYLRELQGEYFKAMVVFDYHGCGDESLEPEELEEALESELVRVGWSRTDVAVIVIHPELEGWVFGGTLLRLQQIIGWPGPMPLHEWFEQRGFLERGALKPVFPKLALEAVLSEARMPRSSRLFEQLALRQGLTRCQDRSFQKFQETLRRWFPLQ